MPYRENSRGGPPLATPGGLDRDYLELRGDLLDEPLDPGERRRQGARAAPARPLVVHLEQVVLELDDVQIAAVALEIGPDALVYQVGNQRQRVALLVGQRLVVERRMAAAERGVGLRLRL